jgi:hypothetical protein
MKREADGRTDSYKRPLQAVVSSPRVPDVPVHRGICFETIARELLQAKQPCVSIQLTLSQAIFFTERRV